MRREYRSILGTCEEDSKQWAMTAHNLMNTYSNLQESSSGRIFRGSSGWHVAHAFKSRHIFSQTDFQHSCWKPNMASGGAIPYFLSALFFSQQRTYRRILSTGCKCRTSSSCSRPSVCSHIRSLISTGRRVIRSDCCCGWMPLESVNLRGRSLASGRTGGSGGCERWGVWPRISIPKSRRIQ